MTDPDDFDTALGRHLDAMARHVDVGAGDADAIPQRAGRQRRRRAARRGAIVLAGLALIAGVLGIIGGVDESPVDTVDGAGVEAEPGPDPDDGDDGRPVEVVPFEDTTPMVVAPVTALGANWGTQVVPPGAEPEAVVRSTDGVTWQSVDDAPVEGLIGMTGRDDLVAIAREDDDSISIWTFDGEEWTDSTLPAPDGAQLRSLASSPTHLLALVDVPSQAHREWRGRRAAAETLLEDRFGEFDSFSKGTSPEGTTYHLYRDGDPVFEGTAAETHVDQEVLDALFAGPPPGGSGEHLLYVSDDGTRWQEGVAPTTTDGVDPARSTPSDSDIGMVVGVAGGFVYSSDGRSWTTVPLDGVTTESRVDVRHGPGYVVASTEHLVATADTVAGPYTPIAETDGDDTSLATAVGGRGLVTVETTITDASENGIDSAAEAESLGLDGDTYAGSTVEQRVSASGDGRRLEPLDIERTSRPLLGPHASAPDGWIIVRARRATPESLTLGAGHRIDPGG